MLETASLVSSVPIGNTEWPLIVFPAPFVKGTEKDKQMTYTCLSTHTRTHTHTHTLQSIKLTEQYFSFL